MTAIDVRPVAARIRWARLADIGCLLLGSAVDAHEVADMIKERTELSIPREPGRFIRDGDRVIVWLSPRSWLVQCRLADVQTLKSRVCDAFPDFTVHAAIWSDQLSWFQVAGPGAADRLSRGGFLSLERDGPAVGSARRTLLAEIKVHLIRLEAQDWLIGVESSQQRYFARWLEEQDDVAPAAREAMRP